MSSEPCLCHHCHSAPCMPSRHRRGMHLCSRCHNRNDKGCRARYDRSAKGKATRKRYYATDAGRERHNEWRREKFHPKLAFFARIGLGIFHRITRGAK